MNKILQFIALYLTLTVCTYALFAFVLMEVNPAEWTMKVRGFYATLSAICALISILMVWDLTAKPQTTNNQ